MCSCCNRAEHLICRKGYSHCLRKVSMQEPAGVGPLTNVNKLCCRRCQCGGCSEELELGVLVCVPGPLSLPLAVLKALTGQKVCIFICIYSALVAAGGVGRP